jgi:hypothetical protein
MFTVPTDKTPYLPPANQVTVQGPIATVGLYNIWKIIGPNGSNPAPHNMALAKSTSPKDLPVIAGYNVAVQKLFANAISPPQASNPNWSTDTTAAQNWFQQACGPDYSALL